MSDNRMTAQELLAELGRLERETTPGPWRACAWDPMERPHVHADTPGQTRCSPPDLPLNAADANLIALLANNSALLRAALEVAVADSDYERLINEARCECPFPNQRAEVCAVCRECNIASDKYNAAISRFRDAEKGGPRG